MLYWGQLEPSHDTFMPTGLMFCSPQVITWQAEPCQGGVESAVRIAGNLIYLQYSGSVLFLSYNSNLEISLHSDSDIDSEACQYPEIREKTVCVTFVFKIFCTG